MAAKKARKPKINGVDAQRKRHDFGLSSGDWLPRLAINCKDGICTVKDGTAAVELDLPVRFEMDTEALEMRLQKFEGGKPVDGGRWLGGKVEEDFKITAILPIYGDAPLKELGNVPLGFRQISTSAYAAKESLDELDLKVCQADVGPDQVPVVELQGFEEVSYGPRSSKRPIWAVVDWRPRRDKFKDYAKDRMLGEIVESAQQDPNDELPELGGDRIEI